MEEIDVVARFESGGEITPLELVRKGAHYRVISTGRSWRGKKGVHILVMLIGNRVFHLLFSMPDAKWYLVDDTHNGMTTM